MFVWKDIAIEYIDCISGVWVFKDNQDVQVF